MQGIVKAIEIDTASDGFKTPREYKYENGKLYLVKVGNETRNEEIKTNGKYNGTGTFYVGDDGVVIIKHACNEKYCASNSVDNPNITVDKKDPKKEEFKDKVKEIMDLVEEDIKNDDPKGPKKYTIENGVIKDETGTPIGDIGDPNANGTIDIDEDGNITVDICNNNYCGTTSTNKPNVDVEPTTPEKEEIKDKIKDIIEQVEEDIKNDEPKGPKTYPVIDGNIFDEEGNKIGETGDKDDNGEIYIDEDGNITVNICNKEYCGIKKPDKPNVDVEEKDPKKDEFEQKIEDIIGKIEEDIKDDEPKGPKDYTVENGDIKDEDGNKIGETGDKDDNGNIHVDEDGNITVDICNKEYCGTGNGNNIEVEKNDGTNSLKDPVITLNGNKTISLGIGSTFNDPGAIAKTREGVSLTYQTTIKKGSSVVTSIDTSTISTYIITYTATNNNKTVSVTRTVKIVDGMGPVITFNPETVMLTSAEARTYNLCTGVTINDNIDGEIDCSNAKTIGSLGIEPNTYTITYSITDSNGNKTEKTRTFIVTDSDKPVITISPNEQSTYVQSKEVNISATDNVGISSLSYTITKDGVVGTSTTVTGTNETITLNETGIYTITVTAVDTNNNRETKTSGEYKIDKEPPSLTVPEDVTILTTEVNSFNLLEGVIATDNTGEEVTITTSSDLDITEGPHTVTYTARDQAGNTTSKTRTITVEKDEGPILNFSVAGSNTYYKTLTVKMTANDKSNLKSFTYEVFKDNVSEGVQSVSVSGKSAEKSITLGTTGIYTIKLIATDQYNNTSSITSGTYKIDTTGPVITFNPETVTLTMEEAKTYDLLTGVSVTDNVDGSIATSKVTTKGSLEAIPNTYTITYTVSDNLGNKTEKARTFIVTDSEKPKITINPNEQTTYVKEKSITISATDNVKVNSLSYVITKDGVAGTSNTVSGTSKTITLNETGIYRVTVTAIDINNNRETKTSGEYKIDKEPPSLTVPASGNIKITEVGSFNPNDGVTATDNSGITPTIEVSGSLESTLGSYQITYKAIDQAGNTTSKTRTITVVEAEGPILNFSDIGGDTWRKGATITIYATDDSGVSSIEYRAEHIDTPPEGVGYIPETGADVSGQPVNSMEHTFTFDSDGIYQITFTATDKYGNKTTATSSTYKIDTTPPTAGTATFTGTQGSNNWYTSNVTVNVTNGGDSLSGHASTTSNVSSITSNTSGTKVTITTTDLAGNSASREYTVKVDKTAPTLTLKSTGSATITEGDSVESSTYYNSPTYSISGGSMSCSPTNTSSLSVGTKTVSCTATGGNGLAKTVNKTVVVNPKCSTIVLGKNITSGEVVCKDPGYNARYVGANPNNYVKFNNELWRIIGIFNGQAKIIRNECYSTDIAWNAYSNSNDWNVASLQEELNGTYLNGIEETSRGMIDESHTWKLGGTPSSASEMTRVNMYNKERGTTVYGGRYTKWTGAIGLMYPSDYGYSTSATNSECDATMYNWDGSGNVANCKNNSWLYKSSDYQWTLSPSSSHQSFVFRVYATGQVTYHPANYSSDARPVLYLKSDVKITTGTGTSSDPFELTYSSGPVWGS